MKENPIKFGTDGWRGVIARDFTFENVRVCAQAVADYKAGKEQALKFLVGQVMKATRGRANPQLVNRLLKEKLEGE